MATYISSGTSTVSNGKTLVDPIITQTGRVVVSNGGTLSGAIASNGGQVQISSGGSDKDSFYMNGGVLIISSGGLCSAPSIQQGATVNISAGRLFDAFISKATVSVWNSSGTSLGYVSHATLYGGATLTLGYYGMASDTVLSAGSITVSGGKIQGTTVLSGTGNRVTVLNGGSAHITTLSSGAMMFVSLYASATTNKIYSGATMYLGGFAQYTSVMGGTIIVSKTGTASATYVSSGGSLYVAGSANEVTVSNGGKYEANGSAWTTNVTVSSGGTMIAGSGTVDGLKVFNGTVSAGAGARVSHAVFDSGVIEIKSAGTATSLTLNSGARAIVSAGGTASFTELNSNAQLNISNCYAFSTTVNKGGKFTVSNGGKANSVTLNSSGSMTVSMGGTASYVTVGDSATLSLYGLASSATLQSGASLYIGSGGSMESATVGSGANVTIAANGKGYGLVENGGYVDVNTNGSCQFTVHTFTGAVQSATAHKGTTASNVTVGKRLDVFSGGIANNTTVAGSGAFVIVNDGGKVNYATLTGSSSYIALSSGASASRVVLSHSKARLIVSSGGSVNEIIVFSGGTASIFGSASDTIIHSGYLEVSSGASATQATALSAGAYIVVYSGGRANGITIANSAAGATVYSSGTATNTIVYAGSFTVLNGGKAELTSVYGTMNLNGGFATSTIVSSGGTMNVNANGLANSTTINGKGTMFVNSYGSATSNSVSKGGSMAILSAGSVRYTSVFSGGEFSVSRGGLASTTVVSAYGSFTVSSGGRATYSLVRDGGSMTVMNGGSASDINLDGSLFVHGVADSAQVNGAGAAMTVFNGGSAVNAVVGNGAALTVSSGGKITGRLVTTAEAVVSAYAGAILDFDLTKTEAGADALVNNLSIFTGATPSYTLTVDGTVADGEYKLAEGASGFTGTISVVNVSGVTLGTLELDSIVTVDGRNYLLSRSGSTLTVTLAGGSGAFVFSGELNDAEKNLVAGVSAVNVSVNRDAFLNILNGAKASNTTINDGGEVYVYDGGSAGGVTVNSGGELYVNNGGLATGILENGGYVGDDYEATVTFLPNTLTGLVLEGDGDIVWTTVHSNTVANQTTINKQGLLAVYNGGVANDTTINDGGYFALSEEGATANNTTVNGGEFDLYYGVVNGVTANGGRVINAAGEANDITVNNGGVLENYAGVLKNTTIKEGGVVMIESTGVASNTTVKAGGMLENSGKMTGRITFEEGAVVTADEYAILDFDLTQTAPGAEALLSDLSAIQGETPRFTLTVDTADATGDYKLADGVDYFGKTITVLDSTGVELGELDLFEVVTIGGREYLLSQGESGLYVTLGGVSSFSGSVNGTTKNLLSGMSASDVNVNTGGRLSVYSNGVASDIAVNKDGYFGVEGGGVARDATVNSGGEVQIFDGGAGSGCTVNPGGSLYVNDGASVTDIRENGGFVASYGDATMTFLPNTFSGLVLEKIATVHSGTVAAQTTVKSGGELRVCDGGVANDTIVNFSGCFVLDEEGRGVANNTTVNNGGTFINYKGEANGATVNGGGVFATYSGTANGITVSEGGLFALYTDGTASDTTVKAGGELQFLGKLTGRTTIETGATAYIEFDGAVLDFDLTQTTTDADALLNDLSAIQGKTPRFTLTVDGTQDAGDYKLAGGATGFTGSLTVLNTSGMELGTLTVDGGSLQTALGEYSLSLNDGVLTATVAAEVVPDTTKPTISNITASTTDPTNQDVVVTAEFKDDVELKSALYKIGDGVAWLDYKGGVTVTENTTVHFKAVDAADNESDVASYTVSNIDRVAPAKPTASADVTTATNQDVTVTAEFSEDSAEREFSTDGKNWQDYKEGGVIIIINGTVSFRGIDEAGNVSEVTSVEVNNIDKVAPAKPTASADVTETTNGSVFVSAVFSEDSVRKQYSRDEVNWLPYDGAVKFTVNGTAYFRGIDEAGNVSEVTSVEVNNIEAVVADTTPPTVSDITASTEDPTNQDVTVTAVFADDVELKSSLYNIDGGEWLDYKGGVTVSENTTVYFKAVDASGNESGAVAYKVTNIDKVAPTITGVAADTTEPAESVTVTANFADDVKLASRQFKIGGGGAWQDYTGGVTVTENDTVYFRAVDTAGNETETGYEVTNIAAGGKKIFSGDLTGETKDIPGGWLASSVNVNDAGVLNVFDGGSATIVNVNANGTFNISSGGSAGAATVNADGIINVSDGGIASGTIIANGGWMNVFSNGVASAPVFSNGRGSVFDSGSANGATICDGAVVFVTKGGMITQTRVDKGGLADLKDGGSASGIFVSAGGSLYVENGCVAHQITERGYVSVDDYADVTFVSQTLSGLNMTESLYSVHSGTTLIDATTSNANVYITSGAVISGFTVNGGTIYLRKNGSMTDVTIANGGNFYVEDNCVLSGLSVDTGCSLYFYPGGGKITGKITFGKGAYVETTQFTTFDFDLTQTTAGSEAIVNELSPALALSAQFDFTLTVDSSTMNGKYNLAGGAADFDANTCITVRNTLGENLDLLSLGKPVRIQNKLYTLNLDGSDLYVNIVDAKPLSVINVTADITDPTNQNVTVTAEFYSEALDIASRLYQINDGAWQDYDSTVGVVVTENNTTVAFKAVDVSGNESEVNSITITNIDKVAPTITGITPSTTEPDVASVTVTADFADEGLGLASKQYRIGNGGAWMAYADDGVMVTENTTVYFKATDTAGNETTESCTVTNISGSTPEKGIAEPANDWLYDKKAKKVNTALTESAGTRLAASDPTAEIIFDATPSETLNNFVGQNGDGSLDELDYAKIVLDHGAELSFSIDYTDAAKFTIWQLVPGRKEGEFSVKSIQATTLKNKTATLTPGGTKPIRLEAGTYYLSMQSTNAKKGGKNEYSVKLANATFFDDGDNSDDWTNMKTVGYGTGAEIDDLGFVDENGTLVSSEWTGFGDAVDYKKITLTSAAKLNFEFSTQGADNLKFSVCQLKSTEKKDVVTYSQGWNKAVTVKAKDSAGSLNGLLLEAGEYYIKIENTNAKKSIGTGYGIKIAQSEFYTDGDSNTNDYDGKAKAVSASVRGYTANLAVGALQIDGVLTEDAGQVIAHDGFTNFVGFGDVSDIVRINAAAGDTLSLKVTATDAVSLTLYGLKNGKVTSIKSVKSKDGVAEINDFTFAEKNGTEFYVGVEAVNAKKGEKAWYNVEVVNFTAASANSLAMPETDSLAMTDSLSFGSFVADALADVSASALADLDDKSGWQSINMLA